MIRLLPLLSLVVSLSAISSTNASLVIPDYSQRDAPTQLQREQAHIVSKHHKSNAEHDESSSSLRPRKSLSWGPVHAHQVFVSESKKDASQFTTPSVHSDSIEVVNSLPGSRKPEKVALRLAQYLMDSHYQAKDGDKQTDLFVRKDSYLDRASGIYHAFVRQRLNGIQIADADLNVAIDSKGE